MATRRELIERAREFRKAATSGEALLWPRLRTLAVGGRVRRQHVIGPFIADFCHVQSRLVIEVDGGVHDALRERDAERDAYLAARGYRVLRLADDLVRVDPDAAVTIIRTTIEASPALFAGEAGASEPRVFSADLAG